MEGWLIISAVLLSLSLLPYVSSGHWVFRNPGFFRVQFILIFLVALVVFLATKGDFNTTTYIVTLLLLIGLLDNVRHAMPYSRIAPRSVRTKPAGALFRLITANVYQDNQKKEELVDEVLLHQPDFILLLETDDSWDELLRDKCHHYPYSISYPLSNYYGIHFFSKYPMQEEEVRFLISPEIPSIKLKLMLPGKTIQFFGIHPEPPSPTEKTHSDYRDAEMMQIAEEVREMENGVFLVTGDLNDVAWSKVTTLFQKKSGLLDPRKGRGLYSTFHAKLPQFLRFPVDHLFHSKQIGFKSLNTVRLPGSDHLGICYEFTLSETERSLKEDVTSEREEEEIEELKTPDNHE